jgi:hypothetical protein
MRVTRRTALAGFLFLGALVAASPKIYEYVATFWEYAAIPSFGEGERACSEVKFPNCWTSEDGECMWLEYDSPSQQDAETYEFRQPPTRSSEVLIGLRYFPDKFATPTSSNPALSPIRYLVSLARKGIVRRASEQEWSTAVPLSRFAQKEDSMTRLTSVDSVSFSYENKTFQRSGPLWPQYPSEPARHSLNGDYLAIQSWDGKERYCGGPLFSSPCLSFGGARYWEDVYDVRTGRRLISVNGQFWSLNSMRVLDAVEWVGDHYFVWPLQRRLRSVLICDLDLAKHQR